MKKTLYLFCLIAFITVSSCSSSSFEKDGRRVAKLMCKESKLEEKVRNGDESAKAELEKVRTERDKLKEELSEKYKDDRGDEEKLKRASEIIMEEMAKCK